MANGDSSSQGNGERKRLIDFTGPIILDLKTLLLLIPLIASWATTMSALRTQSEAQRDQKAKQELLQYEVKQIQIMLGPNGDNLRRPCGKDAL